MPKNATLNFKSPLSIDIFETEPPIPANHPLLNAKNCLLTPHVAFAIKESMSLRAKTVFKNLNK